ncbi:MAG: hypothetical protein E7662_10670 [Ruminococcaceae bacterium]|nr:hypothetical protein [Oscillospiraceae bacterium]
MKHIFCAHRGVSALMPENTLPAFAASLALGAEEIEFDIRETKDHKIIVSHDGNLDRISDGTGILQDFTLDELRRLNIGIHHGWQISFCTPEEVFEQFANKITFNIHVKECGENGWIIRELQAMINRYNAHEHAYFAGQTPQLAWMRKLAPEIPRTAIQSPRDKIHIFDMAKEYGCSRVQFWLGMFDAELIDRLHADGIRCNLFHAENAEGYETYFGMGMDVLLTNRMDLAAVWRKEHA